MIRTFLALDLDPSFVDAATSTMTTLHGALGACERELSDDNARWVTPTSMHVTIRFFGDTEDARIDALSLLVTKLVEDHVLGSREGAATSSSSVTSVTSVRSTSLIAFPKEKRVHVLGLRLELDAVMIDLASEAEKGAVAIGFAPETRSFHPHVTLARLKKPGDLRPFLDAHKDSVNLTGHATALTLYSSELQSNGPPIYTAIKRSELSVEPK